MRVLRGSRAVSPETSGKVCGGRQRTALNRKPWRAPQCVLPGVNSESQRAGALLSPKASRVHSAVGIAMLHQLYAIGAAAQRAAECVGPQ